MRAAAKSCVYVRTRTVAGAIDRRVEHAIGQDRRLADGVDRRHVLQRTPRFQHDHGLRARRRAQRGHERARVADGLDVEQDAVGARIVHERFEQLAEADVDAAAERDDRREADVVGSREIEHRRADRAGLRDQREPPRPRQRSAECRVEPDVGAHDAECAGAEQPDALRPRSGEDVALPRSRRGGVAFGIRQQHRGAYLATGVVQDAGNRARGRGDDREIDGLADARERGVDRAAEQVAPVRVDRVHATRVRAAQQVLENGASERAFALRRADQRDGPRRQQRCKGMLQSVSQCALQETGPIMGDVATRRSQ